jgi:hypothetical protein
MKTFSLIASSLVLALAAGACSDSGGSGDDSGPSLKRYGQPCTADADCDTKLCLNKTCTVTCSKQRDCPWVTLGGTLTPFDCGEAEPGKVACYRRTYDPAKTGKDCSADGKCDPGYLCLGLDGDGGRVCMPQCNSDLDCPHKYRCATTRTALDLDPKKYCRERAFCHPCVTDDQCGDPGDRCLEDSSGHRFCSKQCTVPSPLPDAGAGGTCPTEATCVKQSDGTFQCQHKAGICYRSFKGEGKQCDPCIYHGWVPTDVRIDPLKTIAEEGQCKSGAYCVLFERFAKVAACLEPCSSTCPSSDHSCVEFQTSLKGKFCVPKSSSTTYQKTCWK